MTQETFATHPDIRNACAESILGHAAKQEADIDPALTSTARAARVTAVGLALHTQVVLQGTFIVSKAAADPNLARDSIDHLRRYLAGLLTAGP
jgi:TetR/AcrR family transcriptional repressor of nem operon